MIDTFQVSPQPDTVLMSTFTEAFKVWRFASTLILAHVSRPD
jgi:hypothetical protein